MADAANEERLRIGVKPCGDLAFALCGSRNASSTHLQLLAKPRGADPEEICDLLLLESLPSELVEKNHALRSNTGLDLLDQVEVAQMFGKLCGEMLRQFDTLLDVDWLAELLLELLLKQPTCPSHVDVSGGETWSLQGGQNPFTALRVLHEFGRDYDGRRGFVRVLSHDKPTLL